MKEILKKCAVITVSVISFIFTIIPESFFENIKFLPGIIKISGTSKIILVRIVLIFGIYFFVFVGYKFFLYFRSSVTIKRRTYKIQVMYGDIFKVRDCKRVIAFDECFTTKIGNKPSQIKANSVCGQYLTQNPGISIKKLIKKTKLKPCDTTSKYKEKVRYPSGKLVPNGNDLLMAFTKLDKRGNGKMTYTEFTDCLSTLWEEINSYYGQEDVCIPILGSGITRIAEVSFTQQELLDIIIASYHLSPYKIKKPYKLRIICRKSEDFSINNINA